MQQHHSGVRPLFRWRWIFVWEIVLGSSTVAFVAFFCTFNGVMRGFVTSLMNGEGPSKAWPLVFFFVGPVVYEGVRFILLLIASKFSAKRAAA